MYASHFHLRAEAFSLTPDPAFLYLSPGHAEALAALKIGLEGRRGIMVMVGEVGTGKTTLLYSLLSELGEGIKTAYISNTKLRFDDILRQALADFGVPCASRDRVELLAALNGFLRQCAADGTTAALVIDEAQNLRNDVFENLRLLSNYETYTEKLLQIVLVGQPELETKLRQTSLRQLRERIAVRCNINPLTRDESRRYLEHRLQRVDGTSAAIFTGPASALIVLKARGIPRRINILCHTAMLFAFGRGAHLVTFAIARTAVRENEGRGLVTIGRGLRAKLTNPDASALLMGSRFRPWWAVAGFLSATVAMIGVGRLDPRSEPTDATALTIGAPPATDGSGDESSRPSLHARDYDRLNAAIETLANAIALRKAGGDSPEAPTVAAEAAAVAPPAAEQPTTPSQPYREVRVPRGTTLWALVKDVYGEEHPELIDLIKSANPQIVNANRILAGDTLRFPELSTRRR
ncbi:MAG: AAA family ATPase [Deltaproteobacteria bacterium]|nr:AAA family ATPase [Deltaproteobacteria bacterium]